jgi:hypothetical protein
VDKLEGPRSIEGKPLCITAVHARLVHAYLCPFASNYCNNAMLLPKMEEEGGGVFERGK